LQGITNFSVFLIKNLPGFFPKINFIGFINPAQQWPGFINTAPCPWIIVPANTIAPIQGF
jgi:hypothetical protein